MSEGKMVCHWCQRKLQSSKSLSDLRATRDHVIPKARGGTQTVASCFCCNNLKGSLSMTEWSAFMTTHPEWWLKFKRSPTNPSTVHRKTTKSNQEYWAEFTRRAG